MNFNKCPHCEKTVTNVIIEDVGASAGYGGNILNGISYACSHCKTILSVQINPMAVREETVRQILQALGL